MKLSDKTKPFLLLLPVSLFLLLPAYGLFSALWSSFIQQGSLSFQTYQTLFQKETFWSSLFYSLQVTIIATGCSLVIGLLFTRAFYPLINRTKGKLSVWIPMLFPHFVWGYIVLLLFEQSGLFSYSFYHLGFIDSREAFPVLTNDQHGIGIILTYIGKEVPFVILMLLPVYVQQNTDYQDLVRTLGGSRWASFKDAEWPWVSPVLLESGVILFAFILSAYEVPYLLGATFPEMISILTYDWFYSGDWSERPLAFAAMISTSVLIGIVSWVLYALVNRKRWLLTKGNR